MRPFQLVTLVDVPIVDRVVAVTAVLEVNPPVDVAYGYRRVPSRLDEVLIP